jgi:hypothetical protein
MCVILYLDMLHTHTHTQICYTYRLQAFMCFCMRALATCVICPTHESLTVPSYVPSVFILSISPSALRCLPIELPDDIHFMETTE